MACFIVPAAEAIITTAASEIMKKKGSESGIRFSEKLKHLNGMLWGGSGLLAFEHIWHGEITPLFPFLTSASNPADTAEMLYEMGTSGVAMSVIVTAVWAAGVIISDKIKKSSPPTELKENSI